MSFSRRAFVLGGACCAAHAFSGELASAQGRPFVCGTVDRSPGGDSAMQIRRYSAEAGVDRAAVQKAVEEFKLTPYGAARLSDRWRRGDGLTPNSGVITLGIHFLDGPEASRATVRRAASAWLAGDLGKRMAFRFDVPRQLCQIAITFNTIRNASIVGRESAKYAQTHATMDLADLDDYVIQHEFGHAIGLQHEHQHPGAGIRWNRANVIADMARQGWTRTMVKQNIFDRLSRHYACVGDPGFDPESIMLYPIPSHWTENGFSSGENVSISKRDRRCIEGLYRV
jgi:hypothetical protein